MDFGIFNFCKYPAREIQDQVAGIIKIQYKFSKMFPYRNIHKRRVILHKE